MKNIAVIFGGNSEEREVSIHTGLSVIEALKDDYKVTSIDLGEDYTNLHKKLIDIDLVFIALHGGYGEDGRIQKYLDKYKIKYTGSRYKASSVAMDKNMTKLIAQENNIPVLNWEMINKKNKYSTKNLSFPLIIKPNNGGSTIGIYYVENINEFNSCVSKAFSFSEKLMIEQYIKAREISIPILDGQALPIIEIRPSGFLYDYNSKYKTNGSKYIVPAQIPDKLVRSISNDGLLLYKKLKCRHYVRIDFLLQDDKYYLLEVNTLPGLTSTSLLPKSSASIGITYKKLIKKIIDLAI